MTERLHFHFSLSCIGEGNGNPLQCSFLDNPRDRGAWRAAVSGVAQSQTRLKRLRRQQQQQQQCQGPRADGGGLGTGDNSLTEVLEFLLQLKPGPNTHQLPIDSWITI